MMIKILNILKFLREVKPEYIKVKRVFYYFLYLKVKFKTIT